MITREIIEKYFASEAELLNTGYRREIFLFRGVVVKRVYRGYKRAKDLNFHEYNNFQRIISKIPEDMKIHFQTIYNVLNIKNQSFLIAEKISDDANNLCKSVTDLGPFDDPDFWSEMDRLVAFLADTDICFTDLHAKNVLVRKREGHPIPVIVDYKTLGRDFAPWQLELFFKTGRARKMYRKYKRMKKEFKAF